MNEGMIMALNKKTAVVLMPDGQFVQVIREAHFAIGEQITGPVKFRAVPRIRQRIVQASVIASALLVFIVGLWMIRTPPVVAYVTMDINPSIELGLDAKERVRELRAVNSDAEALIEGMRFKGKDLEIVMNELAHKLVEEQVLTIEDPEVVIASVPMRALAEQWENEVTQKMTRILNEVTQQEAPEQFIVLDVTTLSLPVEVREEAEVNGVSSGKMAFWIVSENQGHELSIEVLKEKSLKELAASWGGVNKVMDQYEQKQEDKVKEDKVKEDKVKEDKVNEDKVKEDKVKEDNGDKKDMEDKKKDEVENNNNNDESEEIIHDDRKPDSNMSSDNKQSDNQNKEKDENIEHNGVNSVIEEESNMEEWKRMLDRAKERSDKDMPSSKSNQSDKEDKQTNSKRKSDKDLD